eukprot:755336-Hanusia_phi.AAC.2
MMRKREMRKREGAGAGAGAGAGDEWRSHPKMQGKSAIKSRRSEVVVKDDTFLVEQGGHRECDRHQDVQQRKGHQLLEHEAVDRPQQLHERAARDEGVEEDKEPQHRREGPGVELSGRPLSHAEGEGEAEKAEQCQVEEELERVEEREETAAKLADPEHEELVKSDGAPAEEEEVEDHRDTAAGVDFPFRLDDAVPVLRPRLNAYAGLLRGRADDATDAEDDQHEEQDKKGELREEHGEEERRPGKLLPLVLDDSQHELVLREG